jgi:alanine racemase
MRKLAVHDLVRCGIALYGLAPSPAVDDTLGLRPALSLRARVSFAKRVTAGEGLSYGLRYRLDTESVVATVPLGYADGVRRILGRRGGQVLIGGRRFPIAGTITMDQLLIDCGPDARVEVGDEVVLLGTQGDEEIPVQEWADLLDTITYEIVCGLSPRLPRFHQGREHP